MDHTVKKQVCIPPYWVNLAVGLGILVFAVLLAFLELEPGATFRWPADVKSRFIRFAGVYIFLQSCFHWSIHKKGIIIRFLWIPVRLIRWDNIAHAEYIFRWTTGSKYGTINGQGIVVTLRGCPYFSPEVDSLNMFMLRHPFSAVFIRFTPRKQKQYVSLFQDYCPNLDFQIGYESKLSKRG